MTMKTETTTAAPTVGQQRLVRAWTVEDAERLKFLYFHGCGKGDMPLRLIADELGRTEAACRSKLRRIYCATRGGGRMNVTGLHSDKAPFNMVLSSKWGAVIRHEGVIYLRVYVYSGLSIAQHREIVDAIYDLTEEGGIPIVKMREPSLRHNRNGIHWEVRAEIDESLLPEPTHDPMDAATKLLKFKVAMQEKGWTEGQSI